MEKLNAISISVLIWFSKGTDTSRTLMTASVLAAALFPSKNNDEVLNENLPWKPVPIHSVSYEEEFLLKSEKPCPRYNRAKQQHFNSPEMNAFRRKHKSLMKYLEHKSGDAMNGIKNGIRIFTIYIFIFFFCFPRRYRIR